MGKWIALCVVTAPMKDSWNSESHAMNESTPPENGDVKLCQVTTKMAKNSIVDTIHLISSLCLIVDFLWDRTGDDRCGGAWSAIVLAMLLKRRGIAATYENKSRSCKWGPRVR